MAVLAHAAGGGLYGGARRRGRRSAMRWRSQARPRAVALVRAANVALSGGGSLAWPAEGWAAALAGAAGLALDGGACPRGRRRVVRRRSQTRPAMPLAAALVATGGQEYLQLRHFLLFFPPA